MPSDFAPAQIDFSWLANLPQRYQEGVEWRQKQDLRNVFADGLPMLKDGSGPDFNEAASRLAQAGYVNEAIALAKVGGVGSDRFGLNPIYARGPNGELQIYQPYSGGGARRMELPEGVSPTQTLRYLETPEGHVPVGTRIPGAVGSGTAQDGAIPSLRSQKQSHELREEKATDAALAADAISKFDEQIANFSNLVSPSGTATEGLKSITGNYELGGMDTGIPNAWLKDVTQTARNASANLKTSAVQVGLNTLAEMRAMSKQGASGMGQLAIQESLWLQNSIRSLQEAQDPVQIAKHIQDIINHSRRAQDRIRKKYQEIYGEDLGDVPGPATPSGDANGDGVIDAADYFR